MSDSPPPVYSFLPPSEDHSDQTLQAIGREQGRSSAVQEASASQLSSTRSTVNTDPHIAPSHQDVYQNDIILSPDPSDVHPSVPLPTYTPNAYKIGTQELSRSLVSVADINGHLALLHSFVELKKQVDSAVIEGQYVPPDKEMKWTWFVGLAVERFDTWCQALTMEAATKPTYIVLPPVDVIMVWHAYMLNPRCYGEDCVRVPACHALATFEPHFKQLLANPWLVLTDPAIERVDWWISTTGLGYDPLIEMHNVSRKTIFCPRCNGPIQVDFVNKRGTGYFQRKFTASCTEGTCNFSPIIMETLAVRKLVQDLISKTVHHQASSYLAGTLFSQTSIDKQKGIDMKEAFCERAKRFSGTTPLVRNIHGDIEPYQLYHIAMKQCKYSMKLLKFQIGMPPYRTPIGCRIMNAYGHDKIYSVELVGAVLRQGSFIQKIYDLGWTAPAFFEDPSDGTALQHAIARYHAFLELISLSRLTIVPTLDIDLVWHTHQLSPTRYRSDCRKYVRRFVDHDDKIEGPKLSSAFENTCRVWKERFNIQYIHCGCPIEGKSIGERLSKMVGMSSRVTGSLEPINRPDVLSSTHPSDHNAVRLVPKKNPFVAKERAEVEELTLKRQKEMDKNTSARESKGKSILRFTRSKGNDDSAAPNIPSSTYCTHETAFLVPIPMYYSDTGHDRGQCMPEAHLVDAFGDLPGTELSGCGVPGGA